MNRGDSLQKANGVETPSTGVTQQTDSVLANLAQSFWIMQDQTEASLLPASDFASMPAHSRGYLPALLPHQLGDPTFAKDHGLRFCYMAGAMANGIASTDLVIAMGKAGMLGSFGAAGLDPQRVEAAILEIKNALPQGPFAVNLIHTPAELAWEDRIVDLFLKHKVRLVEASAYLSLTPSIIRYRMHGIHRNEQGEIVVPNKVIAKISRVEVASKFLSPPPEKILNKLIAEGHLTEAQAELARQIPIAEDLSAEADSGGHTDNRPALALLPTMQALVARVQKENPHFPRLRVGLGGGVSTPASAAAAFAMGAAFILTGSVNQACLEAGTSPIVRQMLASARQGDITMAPAADMFEMGVKVQVLKRGTMFAMRANRLYEFYRKHDSMEALSPTDQAWLEKNIFRAPVAEIWQQTVAFFQQRDPKQIERANREPKHKMALLFRWYLGLSSSWANRGEASRKVDYQIWCGPSMSSFNEWVTESFLQKTENRQAVTIAENLLFGAALITRLQQARLQGLTLPLTSPKPRTRHELKEYFS